MTRSAIGTVRAHSTRDEEALARRGQLYDAVNRLTEASSLRENANPTRFSSLTWPGCSSVSVTAYGS